MTTKFRLEIKTWNDHEFGEEQLNEEVIYEIILDVNVDITEAFKSMRGGMYKIADAYRRQPPEDKST